MTKILILCTGNSCRSQMAEGILKAFDKRLDVYSAGTHPAKNVSSKAIAVMQEIDIDISSNKTKSVEAFLKDEFDYVITVCDNAKETCPVFTGNVKNRLHIGFEDPYDAKGTEEEVMNKYRKVRDEIRCEFSKFYLENLKV
ncbi:MAG: arsenate reductase ArsC [FCB group bacterium]|jgi:arsenate reductase